MSRIGVSVSTELLEAVDRAAGELGRSRAEFVRQALERYLEDFDDLTLAEKRLRDTADPVLEWDRVRQGLLGLGLGVADPSRYPPRWLTGSSLPVTLPVDSLTPPCCHQPPLDDNRPGDGLSNRT